MLSTRLREFKTILNWPRKARAEQTGVEQLDQNFEALLSEQDVPASLRDKLRGLDPYVKQSFIAVSATESKSQSDSSSPHKHSRKRSSLFLPPSKKKRPNSYTCDTVTNVSEFIICLDAETQAIDVGIVHKLKLLLRMQRTSWTAEFLRLGGASAIHAQIERIISIEWRDDDEDKILYELLGCVQALCTTTIGLSTITDQLLTSTVELLFSDKQPSDFRCRGQIIHILRSFLSAQTDPAVCHARALRVLSILENPKRPLRERPLEMLECAHTPRPYKRWMSEMERPVRDCFWIFLHSDNVVDVLSMDECEVMTRRAPIPASGYVGGVEWIAVEYICEHLTLINQIMQTLSGPERTEIRRHLKTSHFEKICGRQLRRASKKFYPYLHEELTMWASMAKEDGWPVTTVVSGKSRDDSSIPQSNAIQSSTRKKHARTQSQFLPELQF